MSSISKILKVINLAFNKPREPITPLPPNLLLTGANLRPGLSAKTIAARIIARQSESGAPAGNIFSGSNNINEMMEVIRIEEIINALLLEAKIETVTPPGTSVTVFGANAGGNVISQGTTTNLSSNYGVIR